MDLEVDKFYEERRYRETSNPVDARSFALAVAIHLAVFVFFWLASLVIDRTPETVIPIDMTIVPPWAKQSEEEPDPNPPQETKPEPAKPKVQPKVEEPPKIDKNMDAVEKIPEKPKKKEFKRSEVKMPDRKEEKKPEKPKKKEFKRSEVKMPPKIKPPVKLPPGKGTARDKPLSPDEIKKALDAGARYGSSNQLASSEEQRCISLISRRFYECWTDFTWSENLSPVLVNVRFGPAGKIIGYKIAQSSGDPKVDQSVLAAAKRADHVSGLSADFLKKYPEVTIRMMPTR